MCFVLSALSCNSFVSKINCSHFNSINLHDLSEMITLMRSFCRCRSLCCNSCFLVDSSASFFFNSTTWQSSEHKVKWCQSLMSLSFDRCRCNKRGGAVWGDLCTLNSKVLKNSAQIISCDVFVYLLMQVLPLSLLQYLTIFSFNSPKYL